MPKRRYEHREPTHEWSQIRPHLKDTARRPASFRSSLSESTIAVVGSWRSRAACDHSVRVKSPSTQTCREVLCPPAPSPRERKWTTMNSHVARAYWPTTGWKEATPQEMGMNPSLLAQMQDVIGAYIPHLHSLLIVRHGYLVFERYCQGYTKDDEHYLASAGKSVISALVGIAIRDGYLKHLDQTLAEVFPEYIDSETEARKKNITIRALLTMTSGLVAESHDTIALDERKNLVPAVLERPMIPQKEPVFQYTNTGPHLLLYLIAHRTRTSIFDFANTRLFQPLGIVPHEHWQITAQGWYSSSAPKGRLLLRPRDMAKFGYLYLNQGVWDGVQVIPAAYVTDSTHKQNKGGPPVNAAYGYLWWITQHGKYAAFFASGLGGQLIYVIPALDLIVTTTASFEDTPHDPDQWEKIQMLIPRFILPAIIEGEHLS